MEDICDNSALCTESEQLCITKVPQQYIMMSPVPLSHLLL